MVNYIRGTLTFGHNITSFIKKNAVMCIAFVAALSTSLIVPIDSEYKNYFRRFLIRVLYCSA